jgi:ribosome biogenesis GTPase
MHSLEEPLYTLQQLGWNDFFQSQLGEIPTEHILARVAGEQRGAYLILAERGPLDATVAGRFMHEATDRGDYPAVGDWVLARPLSGEAKAIIQSVLPRRSKLSRKSAGERTDEQIMATNVDTVFLVAALNSELNIRRIERYLAVIWDSGARPAIILNKADLAGDARSLSARVAVAAPGVEVHLTSAVTGDGVETVRPYLAAGQTVVFVGSSGVGKSSLVNRLLATEVQAIDGVRSDGKGRHTTTTREMLMLPGGGLIIDTPGLRELQLWDAEAGMGQAFADIEDIAADCPFTDCGHRAEPGCAVQEAIDAGRLDLNRLESYRKLQREQIFIESKRDVNLRIAEKKKWKAIHIANRQRMKSLGR